MLALRIGDPVEIRVCRAVWISGTVIRAYPGGHDVVDEEGGLWEASMDLYGTHWRRVPRGSA